MTRRFVTKAFRSLVVALSASVLLAACGGGASTAPGTPVYTDEQLQSLLRGVSNERGEQVRIDDPRATVSGADGGTYSDGSDPAHHLRLGACELFDSYLSFNAANGALATGLLEPASTEGRENLKLTDDYRNISVVFPSPKSRKKSEFQLRFAAYESCDRVEEVRFYVAWKVRTPMDVVRLAPAISADRSFAVSQLSADQSRVGAVYVGGSKGGVDVIYSQAVNGAAADTLDFDAVAREGAAAVNQVLAKIP